MQFTKALFALVTILGSHMALAQVIQCPKASDFIPTQEKPLTRLLISSPLALIPSHYLLLRDGLENHWDEYVNTTKIYSKFNIQDEFKTGMPDETPLTIYIDAPLHDQVYNSQYCLYQSPDWTIGMEAKDLIDNPDEITSKPQWAFEAAYTAAEHYFVGYRYVCHTTAAHPEVCYQ